MNPLKHHATQAHGGHVGKLHEHLSTNCQAWHRTENLSPVPESPNFWKLKFTEQTI